MRQFISCGVFGAVLLAMTCGCSSSTALQPVTGKVFWNGQPLKGAQVTLVPKVRGEGPGDLPVGTTSEDGSFTLATGGQTGAAEGDYLVSIVCMEASAAAPKEAMSMGTGEQQDRLKGAYADATKSQLHAQVKSGGGELPTFELK